MQDEKLVEEIARAIQDEENPGFGISVRAYLQARAILPLIAREVAAQKERDAVIAAKTAAYDDNIQRSAGCGTTGERIAAAIRSAG